MLKYKGNKICPVTCFMPRVYSPTEHASFTLPPKKRNKWEYFIVASVRTRSTSRGFGFRFHGCYIRNKASYIYTSQNRAGDIFIALSRNINP
jgi:hypothetical protein